MVLILFNPATGALTKDPPKVDVKSTQMFGWKDPLLEKPLISLADLRGNHRRQIVVEERVHNGTMYMEQSTTTSTWERTCRSPESWRLRKKCWQ
jgi:hypothetical protein